MDCPECHEAVAPMSGSSWAIAWYSCARCGTFWYARLRVGRDASPDHLALPVASRPSSSVRLGPQDAWTIEELEAEAAALRLESDSLPKGDLEALRNHLEKLKVLADAINRRLDACAAGSTH